MNVYRECCETVNQPEKLILATSSRSERIENLYSYGRDEWKQFLGPIIYELCSLKRGLNSLPHNPDF